MPPVPYLSSLALLGDDKGKWRRALKDWHGLVAARQHEAAAVISPRARAHSLASISPSRHDGGATVKPRGGVTVGGDRGWQTLASISWRCLVAIASSIWRLRERRAGAVTPTYVAMYRSEQTQTGQDGGTLVNGGIYTNGV